MPRMTQPPEWTRTWQDVIQSETPRRNLRLNRNNEGETEMPRPQPPADGATVATVGNPQLVSETSQDAGRRIQSARVQAAYDYANFYPMDEHIQERYNDGQRFDPTSYAVEHAGQGLRTTLSRFGIEIESRYTHQLGLAAAVVMERPSMELARRVANRENFDRALRRESASYQTAVTAINSRLREIETAYRQISQLAAAAEKWRESDDEPEKKLEAFREIVNRVETARALTDAELEQEQELTVDPDGVFVETPVPDWASEVLERAVPTAG